MLTVRPLAFTLKHAEREKMKTTTTTTMITIIIITEMTKIGWWYNALADCCLSIIPQRRRCFFFFLFLLSFLYVYFCTSGNKENSTRFSAIFVLLSVSPHIPTTSIPILSLLYSLFYACWTMCVCWKRASVFFLL